jgi:5-methylcytosine-specific restriction endonuclease McrA
VRSGNYKPAKDVYRGPWGTVRRRILERDRHTCQIALPGCHVDANTVDHITPVALGGAWYDDHNLRAACAWCNGELAKVTQRTVAQRSQGHTGPNPGTVVQSRPW